ncbi:Gfo/Idh/MocA family oxidoreductase [Hymenobacter sp. BT186]|uniref:Gfo/Idh/MocA family oxidoreductase n=1 Tax=Hymenobacter telluris TaxID=2816474 RepID=A0A939J9I2_9BACT|nr:Gfo/Idh/MocA family oxidoreductase [Hymenobacter telluris]MBO0358824.1 Gfo/Idh/MocA family oxidoreductase [Hymenobacter telluris]MBW3374850.1 Gfo/Idh/MocA family oxidoreductase [Hymenobacter norwichensis]
MSFTNELLNTVLRHAGQEVSRKEFLNLAGRGLAVGVAAGTLASCQSDGPAKATAAATPTTGTPASEVDASTIYTAPSGQQVPSSEAVSPPAKVPAGLDKPIELEAWKSDVDPKSGPVPTPLPPDKRVGYALVGLGHLTLEELLPAFGECKKSKPVALVSGSPEKLKKVAQQYGIKPESCYSYQDYEKLKDNPDVQAIYIVLPNSLHAEYVIRGAKTGKHILCEKPMANSAKECELMIAACKQANVKLMVAYRIQYEPYNRQVRDMIRDAKFGKVKYIQAQNSQSSANPDHWRHKKDLAGGGALPDIGLYCLNTSRFLLGTEPTEVFAHSYSTPGNPLFKEVEEMMTFQLRFPGGIVVDSITHYNTHDSRYYRVNTERGWLHLDNAYAYTGQQLKTSHAEGEAKMQNQITIPAKNQFAAEMDHFSECILENKQPHTPGEEGLQDHRIMDAIYQSARENRPVKLPEVKGTDVFRGPEPKQA